MHKHLIRREERKVRGKKKKKKKIFFFSRISSLTVSPPFTWCDAATRDVDEIRGGLEPSLRFTSNLVSARKVNFNEFNEAREVGV